MAVAGECAVANKGQLLTLQDVCDRLRVSRDTLKRRIRAGSFPEGFRLGGPRSPLRWREDRVLAAIEFMAKGSDH